MHKKRDEKKIFALLLCAAALSVAAMIAALSLTGGNDAEFVPPPFESEAVVGMPNVPDGLGYSELWQEGMTYRFYVCGNVVMDGADAVVYFTNPSVNDAWLKLRVLDKNGKILGETGLIKPGEYVENVTLCRDLEEGTAIVLKIMGYEPETYHSVGAVSLKTSISKKS